MILLIEDNPLHRKMYAAALRSESYDLLEISDERLAMETARAIRPTAIVIDIILPFIDGRTLIAAMRNDPFTYPIPILAMSACAESGLAAQCMAAGASRFQPKPTPLRAFLQTVAELGASPGATRVRW